MSSIHPALISIRVKIGARRNHYGFPLPTDGTKWLVCAWKKDKIFITGWVCLYMCGIVYFVKIGERIETKISLSIICAASYKLRKCLKVAKTSTIIILLRYAENVETFVKI